MGESGLSRAILSQLNSIPGCIATKVHGGIYSTKGEADIFGCFNGRAFYIELKLKGKIPKEMQIHRLKKWRRAGANSGVAYSVKDAIAIATQGN